jgi:hypothetical protein
MMNQAAPLWNKDASELLKQFLGSGCGQSFLANLIAARPVLHQNSGDVNDVALRAQLVAGYEQALSNIIALTEPVDPENNPTAHENFPDLDLPEGDPRWSGSPKPPSP